MLQIAVMMLIVLWLLGYGFGVAGISVHLLLLPIVLLLVTLLRSGGESTHSQGANERFERADPGRERAA